MASFFSPRKIYKVYSRREELAQFGRATDLGL